MKRDMHVWIVEMKWDTGRWFPTVGARLSREEGRAELRDWQTRNPNDAFRLMKYQCVPVKAKVKRKKL